MQRKRIYHERGRRLAAVFAAWVILLTCPLAAWAETEAPGGSADAVQTENTNTEELQLYARSAVLMDADSGRILVEKEGDKILPMASTTKIMTCIVVLEQGGEDAVYPVSSYAAGMPNVKLGASAGETYYGRDLLYSMMLESHNDSAVILAEGVGGSAEGFAELMNEKAEEIGCEDTHFVTPNGLDAEGHYTTAADLARIMRYCIEESPKKDEFLTITQTRSYTFSDAEGKRSFSCQNHNAFLDMMDGALSGKTGFTGKAGYCYVGALTRDGKTFIVTLLACGWPNNKTYKWSDTRKLMQYGLDHYEIRDVWSEVSTDSVLVLEGVPETGNLTDKVTVKTGIDIPEEEKTISLLLAPWEEMEVQLQIQKTIHAPVEKGTCVGAVEYRLGSMILKRIPVVTEESVQRVDFLWCLRNVWSKYLGNVGIFEK